MDSHHSPPPTELAVIPSGLSIEPLPQETALLTAIVAAAGNPSVDVDKMERLLAMQERISADQARRAFSASLHLFQSECPPIHRGRGIVVSDKIRSRFAAYEDVIKVVGPLLQKFGFAVAFDTATNPQGVICSVTVTLSHVAGHCERSTFPVMPDSSGSKNPIQAIGSALSYGKRYALGAALGLVFTDEDDDAREAGKRAEIEEAVAYEVPGSRRAAPVDVKPLPPEVIQDREANDSERDALTRKIAGMIADSGIDDSALNEALTAAFAKGKKPKVVEDWTVDLTDAELVRLSTRDGFDSMAAMARKGADQ